MVAFFVLMFLLMMVAVGFVFDLYLYSRGAFGNRCVRNAKRMHSMIGRAHDYRVYQAYSYSDSDAIYDRPTHNIRAGLILFCAGSVVVVLIIFVLINSFA